MFSPYEGMEDGENHDVVAALTPSADVRPFAAVGNTSAGRDFNDQCGTMAGTTEKFRGERTVSIQPTDLPGRGGFELRSTVALPSVGGKSGGVGPGGRLDSNTRVARGEPDRSRALRSTQLSATGALRA